MQVTVAPEHLERARREVHTRAVSTTCLVAQATNDAIKGTDLHLVSVGITVITLASDDYPFQVYEMDERGQLLVQAFDDERRDGIPFNKPLPETITLTKMPD